MQAGEMHDTSSPGVYLSPVPYPPTTAHETPPAGVHSRRESTGSAVGLGTRSDRGSGSSRLRSASSPVLDTLLGSPPQDIFPGLPLDGRGERGFNGVAGDGNLEGGEQLEDRGSGGERKQLSGVSTGSVDGTGKETVAAESLRNVARKGMKALDASLSESISGDRCVRICVSVA